jgi:hypothetical protein
MAHHIKFHLLTRKGGRMYNVDFMYCTYSVCTCTHTWYYTLSTCTIVLTGESPYYLKNLSSGQYELLVIGKRKESLGSLRFKFTIERDNLCDPVIHLSSVPAANGSMVTVTFSGECFTVPGSEGTVQFQCSTAGREFTPCKFVYIYTYIHIKLIHMIITLTFLSCVPTSAWYNGILIVWLKYLDTPIHLMEIKFISWFGFRLIWNIQLGQKNIRLYLRKLYHNPHQGLWSTHGV